MSFLQPFILFGLPLISLPVLIHLINRQRHRSIEWAAMMFLRDARRLTRGMAKLRQILILAMRTLAVAALIFAISRPLASGWLGLAAGGAPDTTIVLLDRSASMEQQGMVVGRTKRFASLEKVSQLIKRSSPNTRIVLIDSAVGEPRQLSSADSLVDMPITAATATTADIPAMMQQAMNYITANETGRTDVWLCSDLRSNDWDVDGGRWAELRDGFQLLDGIRFHLLTYPQKATENVSVHVTGAHRRQVGERAELVMDVRLVREADDEAPIKIPLEFVVNGTRSNHEIEMNDKEYVLQGHTIPLDVEIRDGWGRVELPADSNIQDNVCHFVFAEPPAPKAVVVSDNTTVAELLRLAAETPPNPAVKHEVTVVPLNRVSEIEWKQYGLLLWHAALPKDITAQQIINFVEEGKTAIFFPPDTPDDVALEGVSWGKWQDVKDQEGLRIDQWRSQAELLAHSRNGTALPVGQLRTFKYCTVGGPLTSLASFEKSGPFLALQRRQQGRVYFCSTLPLTTHSSLAQEGVVLYVMIQRALSQGSAVLGRALHQPADAANLDTGVAWQPLDDLTKTVLPSQRGLQYGAFQTTGKKLLAVRPAEEETTAKIMTNDQLASLFGALDYVQVTDDVGSKSALASEAWRMFLYVMLAALLMEALLCVPQKRQPSDDAVATFSQSRGSQPEESPETVAV